MKAKKVIQLLVIAMLLVTSFATTGSALGMVAMPRLHHRTMGRYAQRDRKTMRHDRGCHPRGEPRPGLVAVCRADFLHPRRIHTTLPTANNI